MSNQVEHSDFLCLLLIIYFIIRISFLIILLKYFWVSLLISTDVNLDENEIIRIYGKRWDIEVFFKVCKSYLNLSRECNSLSYDALTAHTAIVFTRYMMLSLECRESKDERSLGELFLHFSDEMSDITWIQAFQMLLQMFRTTLTDKTELSDEKITELVEMFIDALPNILKTKLKAT